MNYESRLKEIALSDERFIVMTAENRATIRGLPIELGERFIDTGITEQTLVGSAAGLALRGRIPVVHALAAFLTMRAFEFVRTDVGISKLPVKLVGFVPGFLSEANGPTHQAIEDVALMRGIPKMQVFCPADESDLLIGLEKVLLSDAPCYIRYNARPAIVEHDTDFELGQAEVFARGNDVAILTYGTLFNEAREAQILLEKQGFSVGLVNLRMLNPLDERAILEASQAKLVVTLEDHFLTGGLFSILSEVLVRNRKQVEVLPIGLDNAWFKPSLLANVLEYEGFTSKKVAEKVQMKLKSMET